MGSKLNELIEQLQEIGSDAIFSASEDLPPLAQEIISYGRITSGLALLLLSLIVTVSLLSFFTCLHHCRAVDNGVKERSDNTTICEVLVVISPIIFFFASCILWGYFREGIQAWVAPRMYLIEQITSLM